MSSGKDKNPPDDLDFSFEGFEEEHAQGGASGHGKPTGNEFDFDFDAPEPDGEGDSGFEFDDMPETHGGAKPHHAAAPDDDFDDAIGIDDEDHHAAAHADGEHGEDGIEGALDGVESESDEAAADPAKRKSLLSKLILPVGGLAIAGAVGTFVLGGGNHTGPAQPQQQPTAAPQPVAQLPNLGPAPLAQQPVTLPRVSSMTPVQSSAEVTLPQTLGGPVKTPEAVAPPSAQPTPSAADTKLAEKIDAHLAELTAAIQGLNSTVSDVQKEVQQTRHDLTDRIGKEDEKLSGVDAHVAAVEKKEDGLEQRIAALEAARKKPVVSNEHASFVPHTTRINRHVRHPAYTAVTPTVTRTHEHVVPPAVPSSRTLSGYSLKGVSRDAALVQTPGGLVRVEIGKALNGAAGVAQAIRRDGDAWVLQTSNGVIRQ